MMKSTLLRIVYPFVKKKWQIHLIWVILGKLLSHAMI